MITIKSYYKFKKINQKEIIFQKKLTLKKIKKALILIKKKKIKKTKIIKIKLVKKWNKL